MDPVLFPHAVNLAEAGSSIEERKAGTFSVASMLRLPHLLPGYLFCFGIKPLHHDLRLMLINTLRKVDWSLSNKVYRLRLLSGPRSWFSYAHSPCAELPHSVPERGCDLGRANASSWVIVPQIVHHPFLIRCQRLQSRLQDHIYTNRPCMLFEL